MCKTVVLLFMGMVGLCLTPTSVVADDPEPIWNCAGWDRDVTTDRPPQDWVYPDPSDQTYLRLFVGIPSGSSTYTGFEFWVSCMIDDIMPCLMGDPMACL